MNRHYFSTDKRYYTENGKAYYTQGLPEQPDIFELKDADVKTFKQFDLTLFKSNYAQLIAADAQGFYLYRDFVKFADAHTAVFVTPMIMVLNQKVYLINCGDKSITPLDVGPKLRLLSNRDLSSGAKNYFSDGSAIYFQGSLLALKKVPEANVENFKITDNRWARDDKQVFVSGRLIPSADPNTFEMDMAYGKDAHGVYWLGPNPNPFKVLDADRKSFFEITAENGSDALDKNGEFIGGKRRKD